MPRARFAGVPVPTTKPSFRTERDGLWKANVRAANATGNSPVMAGLQSDGKPLRHWSTNGNAYVRWDLGSADASAMRWVDGGYFGIKMYLRLDAVAGHIQIYRQGESGRGGPFLDCVDGKLRFGWWDNDLKKDVYVETSSPVIEPGRMHYICIRKQFPQGNITGGNWEDSYWSNNQIRAIGFATANAPAIGSTVTSTVSGSVGTVLRQRTTASFDVYTTTENVAWTGNVNGVVTATVLAPSGDLFIVKRFNEEVTGATLPGMSSYEAYIDATVVSDETINCVSFTSSDATKVPGVTALGVVSPAGAQFDGQAAGVIQTVDMDVAAGGEFYLPRAEMVGMYFTWGNAGGIPAQFQGKTYRISAITVGTSNTVSSITCVDPYNLSSLPDFSTIPSGSLGQISTGIELIKSDGFDESKSPDVNSDTLFLMGSPDQGDPTSSYQPFVGSVWCPGFHYNNPVGTQGVDARIFHNTSATAVDSMLIGPDLFEEEIYTAGTTTLRHQLSYTLSYVLFAYDGRQYAMADAVGSTQPSAIPDDALDTTGPSIPQLGNTVLDVATSTAYWVYVQGRQAWATKRYIAVGFYDPVQGISGRPGPTALVKAIEDDTTNPSGVVRVIVTDLPVGPPGVEVIVYESAGDGDAFTLFEAARVPNGTSEVAVDVLESMLALNAAADFAAYEPPRCGIVGTAQSRLVYGALEVQPDGMTPSRIGQPGLADFERTFRLAGGNGEKVTAMAELDGLLAVFKRRAMGSVSFNADGFATPSLVSSGVGCVSPQGVQSKDSMLWFVSDRGLQVSQRTGVTNLGKPEYVGEKVERFFTSLVDLRRLPRCSTAINRTRNQMVVALRLAGTSRTNGRVSAEQRDQDVVFGRYVGPNVTALATIQSKEPGADLVVGGTEEGFVVWMDREDTSLLMMGPEARAWGEWQAQCFGGALSSDVALDTASDSALDTALAGPMGVTARFNDAAGVEREVALLGAEGSVLHYAEPLISPIPADRTVMIGAQRIRWETPWLDMGNPERMKSLLYVDLIVDTRDVSPTGEIYCALYSDWNMDEVRLEETLELGPVPHRLVPTSLRGNWFKLVVEHAVDTSNVSFDIAALVWRVRDEDQT